jgi:hypothetical protein
MSVPLDRDDVCALLIELGLFPVSARAAADNERITWTDDAVVACMADVERTGSAGALWTRYLLSGHLPPMPKPAKVKPSPDAPLTSCPICAGDLAECHGIHGYAATLLRKATLQPTARRTTRNRKEDAA